MSQAQAESKQVSVDAEVLEQLQQLIKDQQKQLDSLQKQVNSFEQKSNVVSAEPQDKEPTMVAKEVKAAVAEPDNQIVSSGSRKVKLAISGQVNRAMNIAEDGDKTDTYFVDSDASNSKLRLLGTAELNDDMVLGTHLEIAFAPNESSTVNQNDQETDDFFDERYAEVTLDSKAYGKLYFGKGDTASNGTAEVDLSGTDIIQYASYADIAGGLLFRESSSDQLTDIKVSSAFKDFDGLSRKSRIRYDLPKYYGFGLSGSFISEQRWDTALTWSGTGYGLKMGAAGAVAYIDEDDADYQYDGSFSLLHEETGLNFTFSAGKQDLDNGDDPYSLYGKLGWQKDLFSFGMTSFGIDYGHTENVSGQGDKGDSYGIAVVETFNDYGIDLYAQFRQYSLDRSSGSANVADINVATIGTRVKF